MDDMTTTRALAPLAAGGPATLAHAAASPADWQAVVSAFLDTCERRTGSRHTPVRYGQAIRDYWQLVGDMNATTVATVQLYAYAPTSRGTTPSPSTVTVRLAALQSLFRFAGKVGVWHGPNPATDVDRPRQTQPLPKGLDAAGLRDLLAAVPTTDGGLRDRAVIVTVALTGLRRAEVLGLRAGDVQARGGLVTYEARTKGGTVRRRELPTPAWKAITGYLQAVGTPYASLAPDARLFPITPEGFRANLARYARKAGLGELTPHGLRHSAAKLRRDTGATMEQVQAMLGHRSLATTARYLARLEAERDAGWKDAAAALGLA